MKRYPLVIPTGLALALLLAACGGQPEPTPTPTQTPAPVATAAAMVQSPTWTPTPNPTMTPNPTNSPSPSQTLPLSGTLAGAIAAGVVARVSDDALAFVLEHGAANVTADQLAAALLGVLGRLRAWVDGMGGETALDDCRALLPGVIARSENVEPLQALLLACESGDRAALGAALEAFAGIMPPAP